MPVRAPSVPACVCPKHLLTRYIEKYSTDFHQTYSGDALVIVIATGVNPSGTGGTSPCIGGGTSIALFPQS